MTSPIIKHVARAIAENYPCPAGDEFLSDDPALEPVAKAVLLAIREPSSDMIEEAYESFDANGGSLRRVFMDMIDIALGET